MLIGLTGKHAITTWEMQMGVVALLAYSLLVALSIKPLLRCVLGRPTLAAASPTPDPPAHRPTAGASPTRSFSSRTLSSPSSTSLVSAPFARLRGFSADR